MTCPDHGREACLTRDGRCWVCALVEVSERREAERPKKVIVLHMVYPDGTHTGDCEGCLWSQDDPR